MASVTWSSGSWQGAGSTTATSPNTKFATSSDTAPTGGSILVETASPAIPYSGNKIYWEYQLEGGTGPLGFLYTALQLGLSIAANNLNPNTVNAGNNSTGAGAPYPSGPYTSISCSYNIGVDITNAGGGYCVQRTPGDPSPAVFVDGDVIGIILDGVDNTIQFQRNGQNVWGAFNIGPLLNGQALYPMVFTWNGAQPKITINGGNSSSGGFSHGPPSGYIGLNASYSGSTPPPPPPPGDGMTEITVVVNGGVSVTAGQSYSAVATADAAFSSVNNVNFSFDTIAEGISYVNNTAAGVTVTLSNSNKTATISGLLSNTLAEHVGYVQDSQYGITSSGTNFDVVTTVTPPPPPPSPITLAPTNAAFKYSPGNWGGTARSGGSGNPDAWSAGAWWSVTWNASSSPSAVMDISCPSGGQIGVSYWVNGVQQGDRVSVAAGNITLTGITPSASNTAVFYHAGSTSNTGKWNGGQSTVTVNGFVIDGSSTGGTAPAAKPWVMVIGDSTSEGYEADPSTAGGPNGITLPNGQNWLKTYDYLLSQALPGYDFCINVCGGSGFIVPGNSGTNVPAYYDVSGSTAGVGGTYSASGSRWNLVNAGISLLDTAGHISSYGATGTQPHAVYINLGINEELQTASVSDLQASVTQSITALRAAAPSMIIMIGVPFGFHDTGVYNASYLTALTAGVAAYTAANPSDVNVHLVDLGAAVSQTIETTSNYINSDNIHYTAAGNAYIEPLLLTAVNPLLTQATGTPSTIAVNSSAFKFSPANWSGIRNGGAGPAHTCATGAWCEVTWNAGPNPTATLLVSTTGTASNPTQVGISYFLNGALEGDRIGANFGNISIGPIKPNQSNTLRVYQANRRGQESWNDNINSITISGLTIDGGSYAGVAAAPSGQWIMIFDDSTGEGIGADNSTPRGNLGASPANANNWTNGTQNILNDWTYLIQADYPAYDFGLSCYNGSGWLAPGSDVPGVYFVSGSSNGVGGTYSASQSRWNVADQGVSILDAAGHISARGALNTPPNAVFVVMGLNDTTYSASDLQASVHQFCTACRAAAPACFIGIVLPFDCYGNSTYNGIITPIEAAVTAYQTANPSDKNVAFLAMSQSEAVNWYNTSGNINSDAVHPTQAGNAALVPLVYALINPGIQAQDSGGQNTQPTQPITLAVNSASVVFSPGNWDGDTGRGGSVYRRSWNNGAWYTWTWTASATPTAVIGMSSGAPSSMVRYSLNGGALSSNIAANGNLTLTGLIPSATNQVTVFLASSPNSGRWNDGPSQVTVTGMTIDAGSSAAAGTVSSGVQEIVVPASIPTMAPGTFTVQIAFNYVPNQANIQYSNWTVNVLEWTAGSAWSPAPVWNSAGTVVTLTLTNNIQEEHTFAVRDITNSSSPLVSAQLNYNVATGGSTTNLTVVPPTQITTEVVAGTALPWGMIVGDGPVEGALADASGATPVNNGDDFLSSFSYLVMQALPGYAICVSACQGSGWITAGDSTSDVPAYYDVTGSSNGAGGVYNDANSRWNKIDENVSLLDSAGKISSYGATGTTPSFIMIYQGNADALANAVVSDVQASISQAITALRNAAPSAVISVVVPFTMYNSEL